MFLTSYVHPGESVVQLLPVTAPDDPGAYRLVVDLVHEGVRWFDRGPTLAVRVE
jgi:hypothetical protein